MFGQKKPPKYVIELTAAEYRLLIDSLVSFRNSSLTKEGIRTLWTSFY